MDDKLRCQSCGMPLSAEFGNHGTNRDGSRADEYCSFCFQNGEFVNQAQTLDEMIASSIENMTADLNMPPEKASELANSFIPNLRRWRKI
ncbi:MAG TPA: zinc ribbon domain-containing protein [Pyrinomonadaceae bacterium]|jgi:radical SAM superfamily enzyme